MIAVFKRYLPPIIIGVSVVFFAYYQWSFQPEKVATQPNKSQLRGMQPGYTFSVAVDNRNHYIAKKVSKNLYQLEFISPYEPIQLCQKVHTTGLDKQFPEDMFVGYISSIQSDKNSIYSTVLIKPEKPHRCPSSQE